MIRLHSWTSRNFFRRRIWCEGTWKLLYTRYIENFRTTRSTIYVIFASTSFYDLLLLNLVLNDMLLDFFSAYVFALNKNLTNSFDHDFDLLTFLNWSVRPPIFCFLPPQFSMNSLVWNVGVHWQALGDFLGSVCQSLYLGLGLLFSISLKVIVLHDDHTR